MTYTGATKRLTLDDAKRLPSQWRLQPKIDGCYAEVTTDTAGCVTAIHSRTGKEYRTPRALSLHGCRIATRAAVLVGELEDHTEWGCGRYQSQGYSNVHLFDVLSIDGQSMTDLSYGTRNDRLWRVHSLRDGDYDRNWYKDRLGHLHSIRTGKYCKDTPTGWRRAPIVPQLPASALSELWQDYVVPGGEGLVAVNQLASAGKRNAKKKIKQADGIDCIVEAIEEKHVQLRTFGRVFWVGSRGLDLLRGQTVTVMHDGRYNSGIPRFPRIQRVRQDLA